MKKNNENDVNKIDAIAMQSAKNLLTLMGEMRDEIAEAMVKIIEHSQSEDGDAAKMTISHSIVLDLVKNKQEDKIAFSIKQSGKISSEMADPNQPELSLED